MSTAFEMTARAQTVLAALAAQGVEPRGVADDSRAVQPGDLFLAYPGARADGRRFIADAIARGAVAVLWAPDDDFAWNPQWRVVQAAEPELRRLAGLLLGSLRRRADTLLPWLLDKPFDPPWVRDIALRLGEPETATRELLKRLAACGETCQVVRDLFYAPAAVRQLGAIAAGLMEADGCIRAAAFRDRTGLGRKRAIQVLEYFDRVGYTRKLGRGHDEQHRIRGDLAVN